MDDAVLIFEDLERILHAEIPAGQQLTLPRWLDSKRGADFKTQIAWRPPVRLVLECPVRCGAP